MTCSHLVNLRVSTAANTCFSHTPACRCVAINPSTGSSSQIKRAEFRVMDRSRQDFDVEREPRPSRSPCAPMMKFLDSSASVQIDLHPSWSCLWISRKSGHLLRRAKRESQAPEGLTCLDGQIVPPRLLRPAARIFGPRKGSPTQF